MKYLMALTLALTLLMSGCVDETKNEVVVYVAHDQDYSEPILTAFEEETGITVRPLYDTEATKTVGLVNRLLAEKSNPQADVFWNNEVSRTVMLKKEGVLQPYVSPEAADKPAAQKDPEGYWTGFAARARVIIYNTDMVPEENAPTSIMDFKAPAWRGNFCIANPLFGTTGSHVAALFALWGKEEAEEYFTDLKDNDMQVVESNGRVRDMVASGELAAGFTDTDDANDALEEGKPVAMVFTDQDGMGTLVIPNSVMLIKGAPNSENGKKLIDYLLSAGVEARLAESKAMQIPLGQGVPKPDKVPDVEDLKAMDVTHEEVYNELEGSQEFVQELLIT